MYVQPCRKNTTLLSAFTEDDRASVRGTKKLPMATTIIAVIDAVFLQIRSAEEWRTLQIFVVVIVVIIIMTT
jgi:hypothetical protein